MTSSSKNLRLLTLVALLILMVAPAASYAGSLLGNHSLFPSVHPVGAVAAPNTLGFDCAYGANLEGAAFPASITGGSPYTTSDFDGTLDTSCQATYLGDTDGVIHPLVSDNPTAIVIAGSGGGVTVDVVAVLNSTESLNGFDISLQFDPHMLSAVRIDQTGLAFGGFGLPAGAFILTLTPNCCDNNAGTVRLAQVLVSAPAFTGTIELFRVRFDIIGSGTSGITFFNDVLTNPAAVPHVSQSLASMDTHSIYDVLNAGTFGFQDSWTLAPSPELVSQPITFSAASAVCPGCTAPFTYGWDFGILDNGVFAASSTGQTVTITPPPPAVWRVELQVTDSAAHTFIVTRLLPLALLESPVNSALSVGVAGPTGGFSGKWLGGVVTATTGQGGAWRFCPGSALSVTICSAPAPTFTQAPTAITDVATVASETYHFAGVYNNTLTVHDASGSEQQFTFAVNQLIAVFFTNVTGSPAAYTIKPGVGTSIANTTSITAGQAINFTAFTSYSTSPLYPTASRVTAFKYTWNFGDGSPLASSTSGTAGITGDNNTSIVHTFASACSPCTVVVVAQEAGSATVAPSRIQEVARVPVTVSGGGFSYTVAAAPATLSITQGGASATETLSATLVSGTAAPVTFSLSALPSGVSVVFTPNPPTCTPSPSPCSVSAAFTASSTATTGTTTVTVTGTSGTTTQTTTFSLTVNAGAFAFTVQAAPASLSITQGGAAGTETLSATLTAGVAAPVTFSLSALPSGVSVVFTPNPPTCTPSPSPCSVSAAFTASPTATTGTATITVTGTSGTTTATTTFSLTVVATTFAFTVQATPATLSITQGGTAGTETLSATLTAGVAAPVTFSLSALPSGVSVVFTPNPPTCTPNCSVSAAFSATPTATTGTTTITVTGTSGATTATTTFSLTVVATTFAFTVQATPSTLSITQGGAAGTETLSATLTAGVAAPVHSYMQCVCGIYCVAHCDYWYNNHHRNWYEWYSDSYCNFQFDRCCYDLRVHSSGYSFDVVDYSGRRCWH